MSIQFYKPCSVIDNHLSMQLHPSLDEAVVQAKKARLYEAIRSLKVYAYIHPMARYKRAWIDAGYREFIAEDFHFAYQIFDYDCRFDTTNPVYAIY